MKQTLLSCLGILFCSAAIAVDSGQVDDFEDGTTKLWSEGGASPNPPTNISTGGPAGAGDNYLENISTGAGFGGSRMNMFNIAQWSGDYIAAGVSEIRMQVRVFSGGPANIRVAFGASTAARFASTNAVVVPNDGAWHDVVLPIGENDLTLVEGSSTHAASMAVVTEMRINSSSVPAWRGDQVAMTIGVDNIEAVAGPTHYQGWIWETGVAGVLPGLLNEETCFGQIDLFLADDDTWTSMGADEVCWGRSTTNDIPARSYNNFAAGSFLSTEDFESESTQPLVNAGGNLLEVYGQDIELGVGLGEERFGTLLAEPSDGDLIVVGGYFEFSTAGYTEAVNFVDLFVKSTDSIASTRIAADLEGLWRISSFNQWLSRADVNFDSVVGSIMSVDFQSNGVCSYQESTVIQDPGFDTNREFAAATSFDMPGTDLTNRGVQAELFSRTASNCTYSIDTDNYLAVELTDTDINGARTTNLQWVVADDDNYLVLAPDPDGIDENPSELQIGYRAPVALANNAIDGTYLFYLNLTEFDATGSGHSLLETDFQEHDAQGRGMFTFDSTTPGTVPNGQVGSWFSCDMTLVISEAAYETNGDIALGQAYFGLEHSADLELFDGCNYNLLADGSLLVDLEIDDPGEVTEHILFAGYVNSNAELLTLLDFETDPDPFEPVNREDFGGVRHILAMKYEGDPDGNADGDEFTNLEEFLIPLAPRPPLEGIIAMDDINGNGMPDIGIAIEGSTRVQIRDGSTDALISDIDFGEDGALQMAVLPDMDASGDPEIAILNEQDTGQVRVQVRDSISGLIVSNIFYGLQYEPVAMDVMADYSGNGFPEIAVLGSAPITDAVRVQVRDADTTAFLDNVFLGTQSIAKDLVSVTDTSGNGIPEIGILGVLKGSNQVRAQMWDAATAAFQANVWFGNVYQPHTTITMPDINSNGSDEIVAMGVDPATNNIRVQVRDSDTTATLFNIWLGAVNEAVDLVLINDINSDGVADIAVLLKTPGDTGRVRVQSGSNGAFIRNLFYVVVEDPIGLAVMSDYSGNGFDELAALGWSGGNRHVLILDTATGSQVNRIDFP